MMRRIRAEGEKQAEFEQLIADASICHFRFGDNGSSWWCRAVPDLKREPSDFVPITRKEERCFDRIALSFGVETGIEQVHALSSVKGYRRKEDHVD